METFRVASHAVSVAGSRAGEDDVNVEADELGGEYGVPIRLIIGRTDLERDRPTFDVLEVA